MSLHKDLPDAHRVDMGNPHAVIFVETGTAGLAAQYGFQLERHKNFAHGANINFASLKGDNLIRLDTWERGVGLTQACGTGACATAAAAIAVGAYALPGKCAYARLLTRTTMRRMSLSLTMCPTTI